MLYPLVRSQLEVVICTVGHGAPGSFRWWDVCPLSPAPMSRMWGPHARWLQQKAIPPGAVGAPAAQGLPSCGVPAGDSRPPWAVSSGPSWACVSFPCG